MKHADSARLWPPEKTVDEVIPLDRPPGAIVSDDDSGYD